RVERLATEPFRHYVISEERALMTDSPGRMPEQPTESGNRAEPKPGQPDDSAKGVRQTKPPIDENPWATAGMVLGLGAELAVCVGLGWWLGTVYDDRNGTE